MTAARGDVLDVSQFDGALLLFRPLRVESAWRGTAAGSAPRQVVHADVHVLHDDGAEVLPAQVVACTSCSSTRCVAHAANTCSRAL